MACDDGTDGLLTLAGYAIDLDAFVDSAYSQVRWWKGSNGFRFIAKGCCTSDEAQ